MEDPLKKAVSDVEKDKEIARENIFKAEEEQGKSNEVRLAIDEINKKIGLSSKFLHKFYNDNKDIDSLCKAEDYAREARFLSIEALQNAKKVDLVKGLLYVKINVILMVVILAFYIFYHWYLDIDWFQLDYWWEVIFFSLFGVLTNLTYSAAKHVLNRDFDIWHRGWYLSKIFQAPFIALALILFFKSVDIEALGIPIKLGDAPNEVIVAIAYILGLSSRRTWEFIERIKEWLLPLSESEKKK